MSDDAFIYRAEQAVAAILADLESSIDMVVDRISIDDIEVTSVGDARPQWRRRVVIEMKRSGSKWA